MLASPLSMPFVSPDTLREALRVPLERTDFPKLGKFDGGFPFEFVVIFEVAGF